MSRSRSSRWFVAGIAAGLLSLAATARSTEDPDPSEGVFLLDGMAVDTLEPDRTEEPVHFRSGWPPLSASGPSLRRMRLLDSPEPLRDPAAQRRVAEHLERAGHRAQTGQYGLALMELRDALSLDPGNPVLLHRGAQYATLARDYERAAGYFRRLIELRPEEPELLAGYAAVLFRLARFTEAERLLAKAEPLLPDNLNVRFTRLCFDLLQEKREQPRSFWRTRTLDQLAQLARWLWHDREIFHRLIGKADYHRLCEITLGPDTHERLNEITDAIERLQRTEGADPAHTLERLRAWGVYSLGIEAAQAEHLFRAGQNEEAVARWESILHLEPDWPDGWFNYGFMLFRMDRYPEAAERLHRAQARHDSPVLRFVLASALALDGAHDEAKALFTDLVLSHPAETLQWLTTDRRFHQALRRMDNYANLARRIGIPPELE